MSNWRYIGIISPEGDSAPNTGMVVPKCTYCDKSKEIVRGLDTNWFSCPLGHQWFLPGYFKDK